MLKKSAVAQACRSSGVSVSSLPFAHPCSPAQSSWRETLPSVSHLNQAKPWATFVGTPGSNPSTGSPSKAKTSPLPSHLMCVLIGTLYLFTSFTLATHPQSKKANFDASHELEELLLEDNPLKAKQRKPRDVNSLSAEMRQMEEQYARSLPISTLLNIARA